MNDNWSQIRLRVNIKTTIDKVYQAWSTRQGLESWFLRKTVFKTADGKERKPGDQLAKGDTYLWNWHGYNDDVNQEGSVLESNGKDKFSFSFTANCPVIVSISKEQEEVIVELVEKDIPVDVGPMFKHYVGNSSGWTFYLTNLKSILEGGKDLRNLNPLIKDVITA